MRIAQFRLFFPALTRLLQGNMWIAAQETYRNSTKIQEETLKRAQNGEVPIKLVDVPGWKKVAPASDATYEDSDEDMD